MKSQVLIVDDEPVIRSRLRGYFEKNGYQVIEADCGKQMWQQLTSYSIDLIMLDINLPDADGLTLVREIRRTSDVGIILVTGRDETIDKVVGLEMGADDYVTKPFELRELQVRVKNLLWRLSQIKQAQISQKDCLSEDNIIRFDDYELNINSRLLCHSEERIRLTKGEFELLLAFTLHPNQVLSRERLMQQTSHRDEDVNDRTIDVIIRRLRHKLCPELFTTMHGEGYMFSANVRD